MAADKDEEFSYRYTAATTRQCRRTVTVVVDRPGDVMIDSEVGRLRRLRVAALKLRSVARALGGNKWTRGDVWLNQGRCAAWRVARTVTGRLRAHPNERYQQDAGVAILLKNSLIAAATSLMASSRRRAMTGFAVQLKVVIRELDDARALTSASDLSDTFGRSQREFRALLDAMHCDTRECDGNANSRDVSQAVVAVSSESPFLTI